MTFELAYANICVQLANTNSILQTKTCLLQLMVIDMTLLDAKKGIEYTIQDVTADDEELVSFLFSLGCYSGESITVVSRIKSGCVIALKDSRYNIDNELAQAIYI